MTYTFTFGKQWVEGVLKHIMAYDIDIIALTLSDDTYTIVLTDPIPSNEEYEHLRESYQLQEVI